MYIKCLNRGAKATLGALKKLQGCHQFLNLTSAHKEIEDRGAANMF